MSDCLYCTEPNTILAGRIDPKAKAALCPRHLRYHDQLVDTFARFMPQVSMPRWRYFDHKGWLYAWTTERCDDTDKAWAAFIYKPTGPDSYELVAVRGFAQRQRAKAQARRWMEQAQQTSTGRPPASVLRRWAA